LRTVKSLSNPWKAVQELVEMIASSSFQCRR
jgi:hypothetical protein